MFDFAPIRDIARKITVEDDPAKIDRYLARLYATVSKEFERRQVRGSRAKTKNHPTRRPQRRLNSFQA